MTSPARTVAPDVAVCAALGEMGRHRIGRLLVDAARGVPGVVDGDGRADAPDRVTRAAQGVSGVRRGTARG